MRYLVTGATGLIGQRLISQLPADSIVALSRDPASAARRLPGATVLSWDGVSALPREAMRDVDVVFHFAGEPVADGRWTRERKARIRESRELGTRAVVQALRDAAPRPRVLVSGSAVGYYGSRGDEVLTEASSSGEDFLAEVCRAWESEALAAEGLGVRVVRLRTGVVLAREGGALAKMLPVFRTGLGGRLGKGRQWMAWIHVDDLVGLALFAARSEHVAGPVNAVGPRPVTNAEFSAALGHALHRPVFAAVPAFALRAALGEQSEMLLASQRAVPERALGAGFHFAYPDLAAALAALFAPGGDARVARAEVRS